MVPADLLILRLEIEKVKAIAETFTKTNNIGCCVQGLEAALFWLNREINSSEPTPKKTA